MRWRGDVPGSASEPGWLTAAELRRAYASGALSPREVCGEVLARAERRNPALRAFLSLTAESAMRRAAAAEREWTRRRRRGETDGAPLLLGVPVSIKDTVDVAGVPTTMGSLAGAGRPAAQDELFVERLRAAGGVLVGKTNTPEFGMAPHTINRLGEACANPWDTGRTAGGSSGGAAAACAAGRGARDAGGAVWGRCITGPMAAARSGSRPPSAAASV
ncbi:MAG: hypothetical protein F4Y03_13785 [Alphaproteobacteria bacterium]|nr:hypothetical protein [Alphaproteobacteria bacterium]